MTCCGVRDDATPAGSGGAGPVGGVRGPLDDLFHSLAQRRGFREYLAGLLAPRDRNKTLTALAGAEPVTGAQHPAVQRLQFFLSESRWAPIQPPAIDMPRLGIGSVKAPSRQPDGRDARPSPRAPRLDPYVARRHARKELRHGATLRLSGGAHQRAQRRADTIGATR